MLWHESGDNLRYLGASAPPTKEELNDNLFGPKAVQPEWQGASAPANGHGHCYTPEGMEVPTAAAVAAVYATSDTAGSTVAISSVKTQTVEAVVLELSNGTKLLICPLSGIGAVQGVIRCVVSAPTRRQE